MYLTHVFPFQGDIIQWSKVIYISMSVVMASGFAFHLFGSAELQNWDDLPVEELKTHPESKDQKNEFGGITIICDSVTIN